MLPVQQQPAVAPPRLQRLPTPLSLLPLDALYLCTINILAPASQRTPPRPRPVMLSSTPAHHSNNHRYYYSQPSPLFNDPPASSQPAQRLYRYQIPFSCLSSSHFSLVSVCTTILLFSFVGLQRRFCLFRLCAQLTFRFFRLSSNPLESQTSDHHEWRGARGASQTIPLPKQYHAYTETTDDVKQHSARHLHIHTAYIACSQLPSMLTTSRFLPRNRAPPSRSSSSKPAAATTSNF